MLQKPSEASFKKVTVVNSIKWHWKTELKEDRTDYWI